MLTDDVFGGYYCSLSFEVCSFIHLILFIRILQIYDNGMIAAGLNDDPRPMISRLNDLLAKALEKHWELLADVNSADWLGLNHSGL